MDETQTRVEDVTNLVALGAETPSQEEAWSVNCEAKVRCVSHRRCQTRQYVSDIVCMAEDSDVVFMEPLDMVIPSEAGTALITDA